jgi:hypothetical protein
MGLLHEKEPVASLALGLPNNLEPIRSRIDLPERKHTTVQDRQRDIPLDRDAKMVLAWAAKEADLDDVHSIDNSHLIRGLLCFPNSAQAVLNAAGVELDALRAAAKAGRLKIPLRRRIGFFFLQILKKSIWPALWRLAAIFIVGILVLLLLHWLGV